MKIESRKLDFKEKAKATVVSAEEAASKFFFFLRTVGALLSLPHVLLSEYKPKGGDVKIESRKLDFKEKAKATVVSAEEAASKCFCPRSFLLSLANVC